MRNVVFPKKDYCEINEILYFKYHQEDVSLAKFRGNFVEISKSNKSIELLINFCNDVFEEHDQ